MVEHSTPAIEVVLIFTFQYDISAHLFNFFIENFGQTLICYFRPKLRFYSLTSVTELLFKKVLKTLLSNIKNGVDLIRMFDSVKLKIQCSSIDLTETSFFESLGKSFK